MTQEEEEDDCYEIDPFTLDFTKKLLLEVSDNGDHNEVVLVAAKGPVRFVKLMITVDIF